VFSNRRKKIFPLQARSQNCMKTDPNIEFWDILSWIIQSDQKFSVHLTITVHTVDHLKMAITVCIRNVDRAILKRSSRTQFGVSINLWRLAGALWTLLLNFCVVIIGCTGIFWSPCICRFSPAFSSQRYNRPWYCWVPHLPINSS